ncbi:MAG: acetyl-CoA decarbonylase/synthase complex subunit delta [Chloroflexi bacterium RBG_13_54_9]|nr:MAG: acetyl-CoA decarbonylase/synthase complex subunit delta [Chloroflexi bacterium RBG_13_54_9]
MVDVQVPIEKWTGKIREVTLGGGGRKSVVVGGETTLPFLHFEGSIPHRPLVAMEVQDMEPPDWAPALVSAWGDVLRDPAAWAKKAVEYGADLIALRLRSAHPEQGNTGAAGASAVVDKVLSAMDLPLMILGPEVAEKDNEVLVAASDIARGQRVALGNCEEKNYRTIAATCIANNHVAVGKTPIEINLAKQLNVLISDLGLSPDSILMDPTTGALGYGVEYTLSVMERLRLAALGGDAMTAMPMICTVGEESWRQKESKATEGIPEAWGDHALRSLIWEEMTAISLINAGANIIVLRHPKAVEIVKTTIGKLMG